MIFDESYRRGWDTDDLKKRGLVKQYLRAKLLIESGYFDVTDLKKLKPKSTGIYYFRITRKYRVIEKKIHWW